MRNHWVPAGDALWPCGVCCCRAVLSVRIKISRIPSVSQTTYWILETQVEPPGIWKENTLWTVFLTIDCLLGCSDWFGFSSFQHSNDFFFLMSSWHQVKSWSVVCGSCHPALQIRWNTERVWSFTTCAAIKSGEQDWPVFAELFLPQISTWFLFGAAGVAVLNCCDLMQSQLKSSYFSPTKGFYILEAFSEKITYLKYHMKNKSYHDTTLTFYITFCPVVYSEVV